VTPSLRKGLTTGVYALHALMRAYEGARKSRQTCQAVSKKGPNDDEDVTVGCRIVATVAFCEDALERNPLKHAPYILEHLRLYAGKGVGVVTKAGLKAPVGYAAINPAPLEAMRRFIAAQPKESAPMYAAIGVIDGERIAKRTANEKVGVLGGLSILGTTGIVKPVSNAAYIESIRTELRVLAAQHERHVVFTLGNASLTQAQRSHSSHRIVEIGNFIYDALEAARDLGFHTIDFYIGVGKAAKIAQGFRNTHNRYGSVDMQRLASLCNASSQAAQSRTVKGFLKQLDNPEACRKAIYNAAQRRLQAAFAPLHITLHHVR